MIYHTFSFNNLPAHQLIPQLIRFVKQTSQSNFAWQVCWLNNDGEQVIGLLPKTAWTVYPCQQNHSANNQAIKDTTANSETLAQTNPNHPLNIEILKVSRQVISPNIDHNVQSELAATDNQLAKSAMGATLSESENNSFSINSCTKYCVDYQYWIEELIQYSKDNANQQPTTQLDPDTNIESSSSKYHSGLMGFIGYDIAARALTADPKIELADQPCAFLGHYDVYLKPSANHGWELHTEDQTPPSVKDTVVYYLQIFEQRLFDLLQQSTMPPALPLTALWNFEQYNEAFNQVQQHLYQGNSYQINLTQKWQAKLATPTNAQLSAANFNLAPRLVDYLPELHQATKAPFAGYIGLTHLTDKQTATNLQYGTEFELLSCSPELFVQFVSEQQPDPDQKNKNNSITHKIITKPIKGTLPRGKTAEQDQQLKRQLACSEKDKAENVMVVDLLRNDLGKYAAVGSVKVPKLFAIESFSNVHHMVSTVTATIKEDYHPLTVLFNSLPAGSITGAPKKRAVEIISDLEIGPRGAYCGTMGYMNFDGTGQWNVLIRSLQADTEGQVSLWAGGGITVGSECTAEYQECHDKVDNLVQILNAKQF